MFAWLKSCRDRKMTRDEELALWLSVFVVLFLGAVS